MGQPTFQVREGVGGHSMGSEGRERVEFSFCSKRQLTFFVLRGVVGRGSRDPLKGPATRGRKGRRRYQSRELVVVTPSLCSREEKGARKKQSMSGTLTCKLLT